MDEKLKRNLGKVARAARERLKLTQEDVAREVGFVTAVYGRIERGGMLPSLPKLRQLCLALQVSADEMLAMHEALEEDGADSGAQESASEALSEDSPEVRRIIEYLQRWPPERRALFQKLVSITEEAYKGR